MDKGEILIDGEWKSPFYYFKEAFPSQTEFKLISHVSGETNICARLRPSNQESSQYTEVCESIYIAESEKISEDLKNPKDEADTSQNVEKKKNEERSINPDKNFSENPMLTKNPLEEKKIFLNQNVKQEDELESKETIITKKQKTRSVAVYGFLVLCVFIVILFALRRL